MSDDRCYLFRFIKGMDDWGFIAQSDSVMGGKEIEYLPLQKWITRDGNAYTLVNVCYSKTKCQSIMSERNTMSQIQIAMTMSGPDIFLLIDETHNKVVCKVCKVLGKETRMIDIDCQPRGHVMSDEQAPIENIRDEITRLLDIDVMAVTNITHLYQCV